MGLGHTRGVVWLLFVVCFGLLEGCASSSGSPASTDGIVCTVGHECPSGICEHGQCISECTSNDDCAGGALDTCGMTESGRRCLQSCSADVPPNYTCIDAVPTACSVAGDGHCSDCGCPSSLRCVAEECVDKADVGEKCSSDLDCKSDNCSGFAGVCRQPIGAACGTLDCDLCITSAGSSYCSRECGSAGQCGAGECVGSGDFDYCHLPCAEVGDPACPGRCRYTSGGGNPVLYCDCEFNGCSVIEARRPLGASCSDDSDCGSGRCDRAAVRSAPVSPIYYEGICSKPCEASSDCGDEFSCAAVGTPRCLPHCDSSCRVGSCFELPTTEGDATKVCWAKHAVDAVCEDSNDCQSSKCIAGACAEAGGRANGKPCSENDDCQSKVCQFRVCRGPGLQGEACTIPADCAVGTCCTSGAQADTCAVSCD